jgi:hypothetical protein
MRAGVAALALGWVLAMAVWAQAPTAGFSITGELEAITHDALSLRGDDGTLFEVLLNAQGPLSSSALAAGHAVGDEVTVQAEFTAPKFVPADNHFFELRAREVTFHRHGSGRRLRAALASPAWREPGNLVLPPVGAALPDVPASPPGDAFLQAARATVLRYEAELPNFLVHESVERVTRRRAGGERDRVESELAVAGGEEMRSDIRLNGAVWPHPYAQLPGLRWTSDYAERLRPIFLPACGAELTPHGRGRIQGEPVTVYRFRLPPSLCAGRIQAGPAWAFPGFEGQVYIGTASHLVLRLEEHMTRLPDSYAERSADDATDWTPVAVAGATWLLPSRSQLSAGFRNGELVRIQVRYTNYRRFETSSHMTVVGPAPAK